MALRRIVLSCCVAATLAGCAGTQASIGPAGALPLGNPSDFGGQSHHGTNPEAILVEAKHTLYGTTYDGGTSRAGTVFSLKL